MYLLLLLDIFIYIQAIVNVYLNILSSTKRAKHLIFLLSVSVIFLLLIYFLYFSHPPLTI